MERQQEDTAIELRHHLVYREHVDSMCCTDNDIKEAMRNLGPRVETLIVSPVDEGHVKRVALGLIREGLHFRIVVSPLVRALSFYGLDKNDRIIKRRRWRYEPKVIVEPGAPVVVIQPEEEPRRVRKYVLTPRQLLMQREV